MPETTEVPETSTETTFSHEVQSAAPEVQHFVFDPVREAELLREIIKGVEIRARDFASKLKAYE